MYHSELNSTLPKSWKLVFQIPAWPPGTVLGLSSSSVKWKMQQMQLDTRVPCRYTCQERWISCGSHGDKLTFVPT